MEMKWHGHAALVLSAKGDVKMIIDPYESGAFNDPIGYAPITHHADIVHVSHYYGDHNLRARSKARSAKSMKRAPMI
ncbi:MAG: MBL fold metallo-hydrolase [Syntrophorhabdales bacterium]|jgi:L-ascorbate metabolism protein UlaG (beta-lactamase superfamily)